MKSIRRIFATSTLLLLSALAIAAEPGYVVIDSSEKFAVSYTSLPKGLPEAQLSQIQTKLSEHTGTSIVDWVAFIKDKEKYISGKIQKNEYPEVNIDEGIVALLSKFQTTPFTVTWSGGLAITYNDFTYAKRKYQQYLSDSTFISRPQDRRADPIHPGNHIEPLLEK